MTTNIRKAASYISNGGVIAYPTETVYGLGCDPLSELAVKKLLKIKSRDWEKGLIILAANVKQLQQFFNSKWLHWLSQQQPETPTTYVIPCLESVPKWLKGHHPSLAVRITTDPVSQQLCETAGAIVSTSANKKGEAPLMDAEQVQIIFENQLDYILSGGINSRGQSSIIIDAVSGKIIRN